MRAVIILPARLESMRLPRKLLLDCTGRTVLEHTVERALAAKEAGGGLITAVVAACDAEELCAAARRAGAEAVLTSSDHQSGTDRIAEVAARRDEELVVNVQADEPECEPENVLKAVRLLTDPPAGAPPAPMATLAAPIFDEEKLRKPGVVKVVRDARGRALYFSRAPLPFTRNPANEAAAPTWTVPRTGRRIFGLHHLGLYAYRREFLMNYKNLPPSKLERLERLEQLRALEAGYDILVGVVSEHPPGIDTLEEYEAFVRRYRRRAGGGLGGDAGGKSEA